MSHGSSFSSNNLREKITQKVITDTSNNDEDVSGTFVERMLNMIDKKHDYGVLKHTVTNGCYSKSTKLMYSVHWSGISEVVSLVINQQRIVKKFLNFNFGHNILESEKKLAKFNFARMPYAEHSFNHVDSRVVKIWYQYLSSMLKYYFRKQRMKLGLELRK